MRIPTLAVVLALALPSLSAAGGWAYLSSDHTELKGHTIVAVGELTQERYVNYGSFETIEWFAFSESYGTAKCIEFVGLEPMLLGEQAALVVVDQDDNLKLALLKDELGNIKVSLERITVVPCPRTD